MKLGNAHRAAPTPTLMAKRVSSLRNTPSSAQSLYRTSCFLVDFSLPLVSSFFAVRGRAADGRLETMG